MTGCYTFSNHHIGIPSIDVCTTHSDVLSIIKQTANDLCDSTFLMLKSVYKFDCDLIAKYDIILNEISPFAEFIVKMRGLDHQVINPVKREWAQSQLNEDEKSLNYFDQQTLITDKIINRDSTTIFDIIPIHCHFVLVINARYAFPTVEIEVVDIKPSPNVAKGILDFIKKLIATSADKKNILSVNKELIV